MAGKKKTAKADEKSFSWGQAALLMPNPKNKKETDELRTRMALASAFDIPPQGINILNGKPYINTDGLEYKLSQHPDAIVFTTVLRTRIHEKVGQTAIAEVYGKDKHGGIRAAIGTAGAGNMSMIKGYPNELAETRAKNRLLRRALMPHFYDDFIKNIAAMSTDERKEIIQIVMKSDFGRMSAEELGAPEDGAVSPDTLLTEEQMKAISPLLERLLAVKEEKDLDPIIKDIQKSKDNFEKIQLDKLRNTLDSIKKDKGWV